MRRVVLAERAEQLRKELAEPEAEVARLEAAAVVLRQYVVAGGSGPVMAKDVALALGRDTTPSAWDRCAENGGSCPNAAG
jgi:transposase-like protein